MVTTEFPLKSCVVPMVSKKKYPVRSHPGDPGRTPVCHPRTWCPGRTTAMVGVRPGQRAEWDSVGKASALKGGGGGGMRCLGI